ncbi:MAG: hypothetical protein IT443_10120 [Phycisphaeraceae bacterium]|nr:hypothetical protein [Phycisphaeraceae bacterium]
MIRNTLRFARFRSFRAFLVLALVLLPTAMLLAYPEPAAVSKSWQLDITYKTPQVLSITDLQGNTRWFWYLTYKVTNNTDRQQMFIPEITLATDEGDILSAGRDIPVQVFDAIKQREGNSLLESPVQIIGRVLQGADNARESVVIWPDLGHDVGQINLMIEGLSGETAQIQNPLTGEPVLMRKTLMLRYGLPGTPPSPRQQEVVPLDPSWIMR